MPLLLVAGAAVAWHGPMQGSLEVRCVARLAVAGALEVGAACGDAVSFSASADGTYAAYARWHAGSAGWEVLEVCLRAVRDGAPGEESCVVGESPAILALEAHPKDRGVVLTASPPPSFVEARTDSQTVRYVFAHTK